MQLVEDAAVPVDPNEIMRLCERVSDLSAPRASSRKFVFSLTAPLPSTDIFSVQTIYYTYADGLPIFTMLTPSMQLVLTPLALIFSQ